MANESGPQGEHTKSEGTGCPHATTSNRRTITSESKRTLITLLFCPVEMDERNQQPRRHRLVEIHVGVLTHAQEAPCCHAAVPALGERVGV